MIEQTALLSTQHSLFGNFSRFAWRRFSDGVELMATAIFPKDHQPQNLAPSIFFFHGGLWKMGDPTEFAPWAVHLAEMGIVSVLFEYRQLMNHDIPAESVIEDSWEAWAWMRQNAEPLGIDPNKIMAGGSDAGALMALMLAMKKDKKIPPPPAAFVIFRGLVDCSHKSMISHYFSSPKEAKAYSPIDLVKKGLPPLFMALGGRDKFIQTKQVEKFVKLYQSRKNKTRFVFFKEDDHTFYDFNANPGLFEYTLKELAQFLAECGMIDRSVADEDFSLVI